MALLWLNGKLLDQNTANLSPLDRGFTLADGVFETIRAERAQALWLADHLARLKAGADCLGIPLPLDERAIAAGIAALLETADTAQSALRLTLTRGPSARRGLWPPDDPPRPTLLATLAPLAAHAAQRLVIARGTRRNEHSPLSRIKSLNYGDNLIARREAVARGATDALMLNGRGHVACATVGNLFVRVAHRWITPAPDEGVLAGLARARLIARLEAREAAVTETMLHSAEAAFVSNSLGCSAVLDLDGRALADITGDLDLASLYA